jgi:hypothetical protein
MNTNSRILVACEESGIVTKAFIERGFINTYSCDILPTSGAYPGHHLQQDVIPLLKEKWDMIIAFPPCTHLAVSGAAWFEQKRKDGRQQQGIDFFMQFTNLDCPKVAIENPVGIMSNIYRKPDQIIQPYEYGDKASKKTCLWLKGLPKLKSTEIVEPEFYIYKDGRKDPTWHFSSIGLSSKERSKARSKTFPGIAKAMAQQWTGGI